MNQTSNAISGTLGVPGGTAPPLWRAMSTYVGVFPLPVYVLLVTVIAGILWSGPVPTEMAMVLGIMLLGSFTLAEIGNRLPVLRNIGAAALLVRVAAISSRSLKRASTDRSERFLGLAMRLSRE